MTPIAAQEKDSFLSAVEALARTRAGSDPVWIERLRAEAQTRFDQLDFPTTRDEEWKYTNVAPLLKLPFRHLLESESSEIKPEVIERFTFEEARANLLVFVNGRMAPELSRLTEVPAGVIVGAIAQMSAQHSTILREHLGVYADYRDEVFTALNTALIGDGAFVYIPPGQVVESPIHLLFLSSAGDVSAASHPRVLLVAARGAVATVIESYSSVGSGNYFTNAVTEVFVAEGAHLDHYRLQEESEPAFHIGTTAVLQESGSDYRSCAISLGAGLARHNLHLTLNGERSESVIDGLYVVGDGQHADSHTSIDHRKPNCNSHQLYKGILDGNGRAVFSGKIFVREGALHTDARQLNKNLLLSNRASVDTKPQLEIFADDVKCAHGATVGQLEDEEVFYLASRGISIERARALLTYGFAEDVISKIRLKSVREQLDGIVLDKLHQRLEVL